MPLSEHEQRLLDQIEQALYADDPKFASAVRTARSRSRTRRWITISIVGVLAGLGLIFAGLAAKNSALSPLLASIGFLMIVGSCGYVAAMLRTRPSSSVAGPRPGSPSRTPGGLRSRMEERLRRRFDET